MKTNFILAFAGSILTSSGMLFYYALYDDDVRFLRLSASFFGIALSLALNECVSLWQLYYLRVIDRRVRQWILVLLELSMVVSLFLTARNHRPSIDLHDLLYASLVGFIPLFAAVVYRVFVLIRG